MTKTFSFHRSDFPSDFLWGTATSSYQIEGHKFGGAGRTIWDDFAETPGNVVRNEHGQTACDHYHRWPEDLDLVAGGGFDTYRFSTSWARVMPEGRGTPNAEGLDYYDRLVDGLLERGLKPAATLYHWEMPSALNDLGGWRNRDVAKWFGDFTHTIMSRIGDRVWSAAPINEPWCVGWLSHFEGAHAPGLRDIRATARAMHHVLLAHGSALDAMRSLGMSNLGAVCNFEYANPADPSEQTAQATHTYDAIYNRFFLEGLIKGTYPDAVLEGLGPHMPKDWQADMAAISAPLDWIGINYYTRKNIAFAPGGWPNSTAVEGPLDKTVMGWEIYPDRLGHFLQRVHDTAPDLPIYITENGMAGADVLQDGHCVDSARIAYLEAHIAQVRAAIAKGVPVKGYFVWSLLDNYEWAEGYKDRFGLVHVDFESLTRTPKASWHAFRTALAKD